MSEEDKKVDFYKEKDVLGLDTPKPESLHTVYSTRAKFNRDELPSLLMRVKALFVDVLVLILVFSLTSAVISYIGQIPSLVKGIILVFMFYLYEPTLIAIQGGTIGHRLVGLTIRNNIYPEKKINFIQSTFRFVTKYLLGWISFLTITSNKNKRGIHDMLSGSIVLRRQ